jgi:hypothetical protein
MTRRFNNPYLDSEFKMLDIYTTLEDANGEIKTIAEAEDLEE